MLGERSDRRGLWEADQSYLDHVGRDTFYGLLASLRGRMFRDTEFAEFYCLDNGRDSVPPSLLATAILLQVHDEVSDAEAKARTDFDLRWKVALGIEVEDRPFAKRTLQVFRAQLILHDKVRQVFEGSLRFARESGYLKRRSMKVALDTTNILGRGAVKDTYNLLADGTVKLLGVLTQIEGISAGIQRRESAQGIGRRVRDTTSTLPPASREKRPSTGPTGRRAWRCWPGLWLTRRGPRPVRADRLASAVEESGWIRMSAGDRAEGPRVYDWALVDIRSLREPGRGTGCWPGAAWPSPANWPTTCAKAWRERPWRNWCGQPEPGGPSRNALRRPRERWDWTSMKSGNGMAGTAHHPGDAGPRLSVSDQASGSGTGRKGGCPSLDEKLIPLTVPEVRRLLYRPI